MAMRAFYIGVISDTHGLLREEALRALQGSDLIIHAGDMGSAEIVPQLRQIAAVVAVRGNVDRDPWATSYRTREIIEHGPVLIYVLHNLRELDLAPRSRASPLSSADTPTIQSSICKTECSTSIREAPDPDASASRVHSARLRLWAGNCCRS